VVFVTGFLNQTIITGIQIAIYLVATVEDFEILRRDRHRFSLSMAAAAMATGAVFLLH